MRGRILRALDRIVSRSKHVTADGNHGTDGHLVLPPSVDCLVESQAHEEHVVADELRRKPFLKWTRRRHGRQLIHVHSRRGKSLILKLAYDPGEGSLD